MVFYFGACAGGIWKTIDGGIYWRCVSDGFLGSAAIGAIAVARSDHNVIYAGTGETEIRLDVSYGDGIYKIDRCRPHLVARRIARDEAYRPDLHPSRRIPTSSTLPHSATSSARTRSVASFAPATAARPGRRSSTAAPTRAPSIFRWIPTTRGSCSPHSGKLAEASGTCPAAGRAAGCSARPTAATHGRTITRAPGLPDGLLGKLGVSVSPAKAGRVWTLIETVGNKTGLYRSDDYGARWTMVSSNRDLMHRPWYYTHVFADTRDAETVYVANLQMWKSTDGGSSFTEIMTPHGDNHDLWIDPVNPTRMVQGNDGGACVSFNGGITWSSIYNQPTAQILSHRHRQPLPVSRLRHAAGQHVDLRAQRDATGARLPSAIAAIPAPAKAASSPCIPRIPTSSIAAPSVPVPAAPAHCSATMTEPARSSW